MEVNEIFQRMSSHMVKGIMFHEQMSDYYDFLNLSGYSRCHEHHAKCEAKNYRKLRRYFIGHYGRLIEEGTIENPDVIPSSWYRYSRQEVDANTKRNAVKSGIEKWVAWETETKKLYETMYKELMDKGEIAAAGKILCFVHDVDCELKAATEKHITLASADYDMGFILSAQERL